MRAFLLAAFFMAMTLPACAQTVSSGPDGENAASTVAIVGYEIPRPVQVDQMIAWDDVKDYLPDILLQEPETPRSAREIFNGVNRLMREKGAEYQTAVRQLAEDMQGQYPDQTVEDITFMLADRFVTGSGEQFSPEVQVLAYEYAALNYIYGAFKTEIEAQGYNPLLYAPGPVPPQ